jgi:hypothetical protein
MIAPARKTEGIFMPVAQAEQQIVTTFFDEAPSVYVVPEMALDLPLRQRTGKFIASVLARHAPSAEVDGVTQPIGSLHEAIHLAANGDENGRRIIETNARTDVIERTIKTGHVMDPVPLIFTDHGRLMQYGQTLEAIQANSLRYASDNPIMRARIEAETRNAFRTEYLYAEGFFDDYSLVVLSLAEDLPEAGFFTETMSCSIQVTSKCGEGLSIESAFVSGIKDSGGKNSASETVAVLGRHFNVDLEGKTPAEIIDTPILVNNSLIENGAIDMVKLWDACAGGTFFGENKPREDYLVYRKKCHKREQAFSPKVQEITNRLIGEAFSITTPPQAVKWLHKISEEKMFEHAVTDTSIDPRVFGRVSAGHLQQARQAYHAGDIEALHYHIEYGKVSAKSNSCPSDVLSASQEYGEKSAENNKDSDKFGSLTFKCPKKGCMNLRLRNQLISKCQKCGASVRCA